MINVGSLTAVRYSEASTVRQWAIFCIVLCVAVTRLRIVVIVMLLMLVSSMATMLVLMLALGWSVPWLLRSRRCGFHHAGTLAAFGTRGQLIHARTVVNLNDYTGQQLLDALDFACAEHFLVVLFLAIALIPVAELPVRGTRLSVAS